MGHVLLCPKRESKVLMNELLGKSFAFILRLANGEKFASSMGQRKSAADRSTIRSQKTETRHIQTFVFVSNFTILKEKTTCNRPAPLVYGCLLLIFVNANVKYQA